MVGGGKVRKRGGRETRCAAEAQAHIGMRWRGSETGRDSRTLRKRKVEKGRKEWWGPDLGGDKRKRHRMDTKAGVKEE